ncbi:hypothetical protein [Pyrodictium delaneyi]|uniref:Uncharacterized protein n=1 Tax=Pyrodictium delaneyi TaxID=1273541 RepID=A0A211YRD1_9CREN|nr:hypothetical protein [Pyrodictium delaneyi]OWJ55570.1 hypothetical protein Pdsh_01930 [Pyrodictium delaneyi]
MLHGPSQYRRCRGIGSLVGAVIIAVILLAIIGFFIAIMDLINSYTETVMQLTGERATTSLLAGGVTGYWLEIGSNLYIHLESRHPETILVTSLTVVWDDTSYTIVDRNNGSLAALDISATLTSPTGSTTTVDNFPIPLGPGYTLDITLNGYAAGRDAVTVSLTLSASPVVAVIPLKNYYDIYPNVTQFTANVNTITSLYAELNATSLDWTQTWLGTLTAYHQQQGIGIIDADKVYVFGEVVSGTYKSLSNADKDLYVVEGIQTIVVDNFTLSQNNLIYAIDFEGSDPFAGGEWSTRGGTWIWRDDIGYGGTAGIGQIDNNAVGGIADGYEVIAFPTINTIPNKPFYMMVHVYAETGFDDLVLYESNTGYAYCYTLDADGNDIEIWRYYGRWGRLGVINNEITAYTWYTSLAYYDPNTGYMKFTVIDEAKNVWVLEVTDDTIFPDSFAVGTYEGTAIFDNLIVSLANPRFLNITVLLDGVSVGSGWIVELYDGNGNLIASNTTNADGIAVLDVTWRPIIHGAYLLIYDNNGVLVDRVDASFYLGTDKMYGGNAYTVNLVTGYRTRVTVSSVVPAGLQLLSVGAKYTILANVSGTLRLYFYNWTSDVWQPVGIYSVGAGDYIDVRKSYPVNSGIMNTANNTVSLRIVFETTSGPSSISIDMENAIYEYLVTSTFQALLVAVGGSSRIDLYSFTANGVIYEYSLNAYTMFDGSAAIAYDIYHNVVLLVNTTGVYAAKLKPDANFTLVATACSSLGRGVEVEAINTTNNSYLVVLRGGDSDEYCIVDLSTNTTIVAGSLSAYLNENIVLNVTYVYPASAHSEDQAEAYFLVYSLDRNTPIIINTSASSVGSWSIYTSKVPGGHSLGLTWTPSGLQLLLERGSLYLVNQWNTTRIPGLLDFIPWGPGDRLEYYNATHLLFVRADATREVWLIGIG